jgi:quinoprotein glucose dehydrogenase
VLRCEPDGRNLEVFASGLRNPQELAFDEYGNLFTCDNNSDSGDQCRWLHIVEGGDYGWRIGYQFHDVPTARGPWNNERLWTPDVVNRAAYLLPAIRNISDGPSGLTYHPGTGRIGDQWKGHFFLVDFRGSSSQSGIRTIKLEPKGATFSIAKDDRIVWQVLATDCDFGPDGALYLTDWVEGWEKTGKGRIYRLLAPGEEKNEAALRTRDILAKGVASLENDGLVSMLGDADQRVRQAAQFALAKREALFSLVVPYSGKPNEMTSIHAIWALGQVVRNNPWDGRAYAAIRASEPKTTRARAAWMNVLGDVRDEQSRQNLEKGLSGGEAVVQFQAAIALGKLSRSEASSEALRTLLAAHGNDPMLRHAAVMGLVGAATPTFVVEKLVRSDSEALRLGAILVLRRWKGAAAADLLEDAVPLNALEAARAIYDVPIPEALPRLAALAKTTSSNSDPFLRRVLAANYRLGGAEHAANVAAIAAKPGVPEAIRNEAVYELIEWAKPSGRDRVLGLWRPIEPRSAEPAAAALRSRFAELLKLASSESRKLLATAVARLSIAEGAPVVREIALNPNESGAVRAECLRTLAALHDAKLAEVVQKAAASANSEYAIEGRRQLARLDPDAAIKLLEKVVETGRVNERQAALATLGEMDVQPAAAALLRTFDALKAGKLTPTIQLDLLDAATKRGTPELKTRLAEWEAARPKGDALAPYRECLQGGDSKSGRNIFLTRVDVYCLRCHKVGNDGGEVGPNLSSIGNQKTREYLLESIVAPNAQIAQGFESVILLLDDGTTVAGVLRSEDAKEVRIITAEAKTIVVPKSKIEQRKRGPSAMPQDLLKHLSKRDVRDLVEFLAAQKK